tara:strand:+ start:160 stop:411 length:252 start_codon:yes stop_codon:yes gene_type:complete
MKLTKEQKNILANKEYFQTEGIVGSIFARLLKSKLKKDKGFKKAVDDLDKASDKLKVQIKQAQKDGIKIPPGLLVYAGLKQPR